MTLSLDTTTESRDEFPCLSTRKMITLIAVKTPLGKDELYLKSLRGEEEFSRLFRYELEFWADTPSIDPKDIVGKNITVSIRFPDKSERFFNGIVSRFAYTGNRRSIQLVSCRDGAGVVVPDADRRTARFSRRRKHQISSRRCSSRHTSRVLTCRS